MHSMKKGFFLVGIICCLFFVEIKAQTLTVNGVVTDAKTGETLIGVNIGYGAASSGASTNSYGFYSLKLPYGTVKLSYSYVGYKQEEFELVLKKDTTINIQLTAKILQLHEVIVTSNRGNRVDKGWSAVHVPVSVIKNTPAFFGESDLMKSLQYIPGVQNAAEGKSNLTIRGGSPDQNLILLDGIPIYNADHAFGFLSVFNTEAVKNVTLYKSGYPARFGSRLSSVIDINTKDGNKGHLRGSATLGLLATSINIEGPVVKDKTSFFLSARRSLIDLYLVALQKQIYDDDSKNDKTNFMFYDINAKIHHKIGDKTSVYIIAYNGKDKLMNKTGSNIPDEEVSNSTSRQDWRWGNTICAVRLNSAIASNMFLNTTFAYNSYKYKTIISDNYTQNNREIVNTLDYSSGVNDYSFSSDYEYISSNNHFLRIGLQFVSHKFRPEVLSSRTSESALSGSDVLSFQSVRNNEFSFYAEDEWNVTKNLKMNMGIRLSSFHATSATYYAVDPRLSLRYMLTKKLSLVAEYTHTEQYVHLLSNNSILLQTDLWVPATTSVKPMQSRQLSLGVNMSVAPKLTFSMSGYYKNMDHVIEYKDGASFSGTSSGWENKVESGIGRSYGLELSLEKNLGNTTGSLSYTLAKTERKFNEINYGEWFPSKYDRRHNINAMVMRKLNSKVDFTFNWTYSSGNMMTIPVMSVVTPDIPYYPRRLDELTQPEHRNNYRMPAFHRLDAGMNYTPGKRENRYGIWNFSIYNVYNRLNSFKIYVETDVSRNSSGELVYTKKLKQVALFPVMPAVSYTYKF